jgi:hypothetical protein
MVVTGQSPRAMEPRLGLFGDILDELAWTFRGRKGWMLGILLSLVEAWGYLALTQGDPRHFGDIKSANIAVAVGVWVLANPINTNQLGNDIEREVASLHAGDSVGRILAIKGLALAILLVPLLFLITIVHRLFIGRWTLLGHTLVWDIGAVFLWLGVGSVVSVLLPFRTIATQVRLKARKTWLRYGLHQAAMYAGFFVLLPLHLLFVTLWGLWVFGRPSDHYLDYGLLYLAMGFITWAVGLAIADLYGRRCRAQLLADLHRDDWARDQEVVPWRVLVIRALRRIR